MQLKRTLSPLLGVDIGSSSVCVVALSEEKQKGLCLDGHAIVPLPLDAVIDEEIIKSDTVTDAIQKAIVEANIHIKEVAIAIPDTFVITKIIQMPDFLTEDDIENLMLMEADKHIPYRIDEVNIDFQVLGPSKKTPENVDLLLVACHKKPVQSRIAVVENAGLKVGVVDIESYAIRRASELMMNRPSDLFLNEKSSDFMISFGLALRSFTQ